MRRRHLIIAVALTVVPAGCGGRDGAGSTASSTVPDVTTTAESATSTMVSTTATRPSTTATTTEPVPATTSSSPASTAPTTTASVPVSSSTTAPDAIRVLPESAPSGTRFEVAGTGCAPPNQVTIEVSWIGGPRLLGPNHPYSTSYADPAPDGAWSQTLDTSLWLHWVEGDEGPDIVDGWFYNGTGANPGDYLVEARCGEGAYSPLGFTITDEPRRYPIDPTEPIPPVIADIDDTEYRNLGRAGDFLGPRGSGCVVEGGRLPDGVWFGFLDEATPTSVTLDLACFYADMGAVDAAREDGTEPGVIRFYPSDAAQLAWTTTVLVQNRNPATFTVPVAAGAGFWPLRPRTATGEDAGGSAPWVTIDVVADDAIPWEAGGASFPCSEPGCGMWLYVEGGVVSALRSLPIPAP